MTKAKQTDVSVVDDILNSVLSLYRDASEIAVPYVPDFMRYKGINEALRGFNPDTHVIVTKEQLDLTKQLQALSGMASTVNKIAEVQKSVAVQVDEVHAINTGKFVKPETKKLTKKQRELEELLQLSREADIRIMNKANKRQSL
jgi:hypothetical protein